MSLSRVCVFVNVTRKSLRRPVCQHNAIAIPTYIKGLVRKIALILATSVSTDRSVSGSK